MSSTSAYLDRVLGQVVAKNPSEPEFHQAVSEVVQSIGPVLERHRQYEEGRVLERMVEPERVIMFQVPWVDDAHEIHVNRGFRIQMNSALGPYKGGLRFHPSVTLGVLKFLAFEQVFKDSLTSLPLGGGKGGSDFDPKGRSDREIRRFCQSFMTELHRHIGQFTDIPAGDIGVGAREIGYLFGQYKRITNQFTGALTGKGAIWGGSLIRPEATGYGVVYFAQEMLATRSQSLAGKRCLVSGSGNVAQYTTAKLIELGALPITLSDSDGFIVDNEGIDAEKLQWVFALKNERRGRIREYVDEFPHAVFTASSAGDHNPLWAVPADCAFPSATQNEVQGADAKVLVENGTTLVAEGANMPTTPDAIEIFRQAGILYGPAKASNAGGVAVSGLEMTQDAEHLSWPAERVDRELHAIMSTIHTAVRTTAEAYGKPGDYLFGANAAGFVKVADAMLDEAVF